jgi:Domain of unknown function (DUF4926)
MANQPKLNDVIAPLADAPEADLTGGQVGTVIEVLSPTHLLVEFSDDDGKAYAISNVAAKNALVLQYEREVA